MIEEDYRVIRLRCDGCMLAWVTVTGDRKKASTDHGWVLRGERDYCPRCKRKMIFQ